jgi:hypothetical protein
MVRGCEASAAEPGRAVTLAAKEAFDFLGAEGHRR